MDEYTFFAGIALSHDLKSYEEALIPYFRAAFSVENILAVRFHQNSLPEVLFCWIEDPALYHLFNEQYHKLGFMIDPFYQRAFAVDGWETGRLRDIAPDRFESSEYFTRYYGETRMVDEIGFVARMDETTSLHLSVGRNLGESRFRSSDVVRFNHFSKVLAPKLMQIMRQKPVVQPVGTFPLEQKMQAMAAARGSDISLRQAEVAALIIQGHSSRAIGMKLNISIHTVKVHRRSLYQKLAISSQSELLGLLASYVGLHGEEVGYLVL